MADLVAVLDAVDRAVAEISAIAPKEASARAHDRLGELRQRRGFHGDTLVLALAGGTGVGKSSLLNALAGRPVASVSSLRPHTDRPLAWVPPRLGGALDDLFMSMGISTLVTQDRGTGFALIDLPDMDSVAEQHRRTVEDLIPRIDGVVWVLDPVKYHDPSLHSGFLQPLSEYRDHFHFVLNKVDVLDARGREHVLEDVRRVLEGAGYPSPVIHAVAAAPAMGAPEGISLLRSHLAQLASVKRLAVRKWLIDISRELRDLGRGTGIWNGASVGFRERWERDRDSAVAGVMPGKGPGSRSDAVCRLEDLIAMIAVEVGAPTGGPIRDRFPEGSVDAALESAAKAAVEAAGETKRKRKSAEAATTAATAVVESELGAPLRGLLDDRARVGAVLAEAVLAVTEAMASVETDGASDSARDPVSAGAPAAPPPSA